MRGGILLYAAQAIPPIDADLSRSRRGIAENGHLWTETNYRTDGDVCIEGDSDVNFLSEVTVREWKSLYKWNFNSHFKQKSHIFYFECIVHVVIINLWFKMTLVKPGYKSWTQYKKTLSHNLDNNWKRGKKDIFFNTEESMNLADDEELMGMMVKAGFDSVFIGIETPNEESLTE